MDSIRENQGDGKPFLAYLAFTAVHDPVQVPEPYRGKYNDGYEALKVRRWEAAKKIGVVRQDAKLADRHPGIKPWDELSDEERALEARGMEVYAGMLEASHVKSLAHLKHPLPTKTRANHLHTGND